MIEKINKILVLAPHTDDGELGCGGSIVRFIEEGNEVFYIAFSIAEDAVPEGYPKNILEFEVKEATKILGIKPQNLVVYKFKGRKLNYVRQEILDELIKIKKEISPDLVFLPSPNDTHQDHYIIATEGMRAFKQTNIFGYEMPWNNFVFHTQAFIKLQEHHIAKKIEAVKAYKSQQNRPYINDEFIKSQAVMRGTQISAKYAEVFETIRLVI